MGLRDRLMAGMARQFGRPEGILGKLAARSLNKSNRGYVLAAIAATGLEPRQSAADIGFGGGVGLQPLLDRVGPDGHVHGVDISETMVAAAKSRFAEDVAAGRMVVHLGDLAALPLPDDSLDAAITINTVYFVDHLERAVAELARVIRPGGRLVVGVADPAVMEKIPITAYGFTIRPVDELAALLQRTGFDDVHDERVGDGAGAFHLLVGDRSSSDA